MQAMRYEAHWGRVVRCFAERPPSVDALFKATVSRVPQQEALVDGQRRMTFAALDAAVTELAAGLAARGVGRGDRIALLLDNRVEFLQAVLAAARLGAIVVPIGTRLQRPEIAFICADSEAAVLIFEAGLEDRLPRPEELPALRLRVAVGGEVAGATPFAAVAAAGPLPDPQVEEEETCAILYTSGTTGRPKGAELTHLGVVHSCIHWCEGAEIREGDRTVLVVPGSHVTGLCGILLPFVGAGACVVLLRGFKAAPFLEAMAEERITHALLVPAMYGLCLLEAAITGPSLKHWRAALYGGAPMPAATIRRMTAAQPQLSFSNAYGATETTSPTTIMPLPLGVERADSVGPIVPCGEVRIMDDRGCELPTGRSGEIWIAGPMVVPRYWRNEAATAQSFCGGYWKSGDIGSLDAGGFLYVHDRKKDMINRGGYKVYATEVEHVLCAHEGVVEAAVVGRADPILGERVIAYVCAKGDGLSPEELRSFCSARLADYKVPERVLVGSEPLPRNANGKLQKQPLREAAAQLTGIGPRS